MQRLPYGILVRPPPLPKGGLSQLWCVPLGLTHTDLPERSVLASSDEWTFCSAHLTFLVTWSVLVSTRKCQRLGTAKPARCTGTEASTVAQVPPQARVLDERCGDRAHRWSGLTGARAWLVSG